MVEPSSTHPPMMTPAARCPASRETSTTRVRARVDAPMDETIFLMPPRGFATRTTDDDARAFANLARATATTRRQDARERRCV